MRFTPQSALAGLIEQIAASAPQPDLYVVGGTVRDVLLGKELHDLDLALAGDARGWARTLADRLDGRFVALDDERDVARVILTDGAVRHIDVSSLAGTLEADLRRRDFTIDAMAVRAGSDEVIDPLGGEVDIKAQLVRMTAPAVFDADPLRLLRGPRIASELGFTMEDATKAAIHERAALVLHSAPERQRDELMRILSLPRAETGLRLLDGLGLLDVLVPELAAGKGVEQPKEHAYDVFEHNIRTVEALDIMLGDGKPVVGATWMWEALWATFGWMEGELRAYLAASPNGGYSRGSLLRLAGLLHDVAKPATRAEQPDGRVRFFGHAELGAEMAAAILRRLCFSGRYAGWVALLVREHLRPVQLAQVGEAPTRRALYRFFKDLGDGAEAVLLLSLADAAAARGENMTSEGWRRQVAYMNSVVVRSLEDTGIVHPPRLLTGHDIMSELQLPPGPLIGRLLASLEDAQAAGDVQDREAALAFVSEQLRAEERAADRHHERG